MIEIVKFLDNIMDQRMLATNYLRFLFFADADAKFSKLLSNQSRMSTQRWISDYSRIMDSSHLQGSMINLLPRI